MIREGVPIDALTSATTQHLDEQYRQTGAVVWSPTYCEPAYDRLHSEWTMRRAQQRRLREQAAERMERAEAWSAEGGNADVGDEVMAKYRCAKPTDQPTPSNVSTTTGEDVRREIDALMLSKDADLGR